MDKYSEIVAFVQSAELSSFSAAARALELTPSAVSKLVTRLENRLRVRLFNRQSKAVALTEEGIAYLHSARAVVEAMAEADSVAESLPRSIRGTIRVHSMFTFVTYQILPWLPEFIDEHPGLNVEFHVGPQFVDLFDQGIDLAIHSGVLPDSRRVARQIASSRWVVCASPGYIEKHGQPATPEALRALRCLGFSFKSQWNIWPFHYPDNSVAAIEVHGQINTTHGDLLRDLALNDTGIVRLAEFHIHNDLEAGTLVRVLPEYLDQTREPIFMVYPSRRNQSPRVKTFCDYLEKKVKEMPWNL